MIVDDVYYNEFSGITSILDGDRTEFHDSIHVYLDGDHSGGYYFGYGEDQDEFPRRYNQQAQGYGAVVEAANGNNIQLNFSSEWVQWPNEPPYADAGGSVVGDSPFISTIELYVTPFDLLLWDEPDETNVSALSPGAIINSIYDWEDLIGEPVLTLIDFVPGPRSEVQQLDPADLDFQIWLGWNAKTNRIYVAAIMSDDVYVNEYVRHWTWRVMNQHDCIGISLDGDHSGGRWAPEGRTDTQEEELFWNQQAQAYDAVAYVEEGSSVSLFPTSDVWSDDWMVTPPYAEGGGGVYGEKPLFWIVEFAVTPFDRLLWNDPGESRASELEAGKIIGFDMWVGDHDRGPGANFEDYYVLGLLPERDGNADLFVDGLLQGATPTAGEEGSVVEDVSWGRIKASLQYGWGK